MCATITLPIAVKTYMEMLAKILLSSVISRGILKLHKQLNCAVPRYSRSTTFAKPLLLVIKQNRKAFGYLFYLGVKKTFTDIMCICQIDVPFLLLNLVRATEQTHCQFDQSCISLIFEQEARGVHLMNNLILLCQKNTSDVLIFFPNNIYQLNYHLSHLSTSQKTKNSNKRANKKVESITTFKVCQTFNLAFERQLLYANQMSK